jgi:hypothetical protein
MSVLYIKLLEVYERNERNVDKTQHVRYLFQNISSHPQLGHAFPVQCDISRVTYKTFH